MKDHSAACSDSESDPIVDEGEEDSRSGSDEREKAAYALITECQKLQQLRCDTFSNASEVDDDQTIYQLEDD